MGKPLLTLAGKLTNQWRRDLRKVERDVRRDQASCAGRGRTERQKQGSSDQGRERIGHKRPHSAVRLPAPVNRSCFLPASEGADYET